MTDNNSTDDIQDRMLEMSRSMFKFSWAMTMFGAQQAASMMTMSRMAKPGTTLASAFDAVSDAVESQFRPAFKNAYKAGSAMAWPINEIPTQEMRFAMQKIVMQPAVFAPMKVMMPQMAATMSAFIPDRDPDLARIECENKMYVMQLVQDVSSLCPPKDVYVPLEEIVQKAYDLGDFPALWAVEGLGHYVVEAAHHRKEELVGLLNSKEHENLQPGSLTMLHAGLGLGLAEFALEGLKPSSADADFDAAIELFIEQVMASSQKGYEGCALESLGLVARHFYGDDMVLAVDKRLAVVSVDAQRYFWHGVGRAVYFSPNNMMPGMSSPWPGVKICTDLPPHEIARRGLASGFGWGLTMVNLRQPEIIESFLEYHGYDLAETPGFSNGICSALTMRHDTTPGEAYLEAFLSYETGSDEARIEELWQRLVHDPANRAVREYHQVLLDREVLGEIFREQSLADLAG